MLKIIVIIINDALIQLKTKSVEGIDQVQGNESKFVLIIWSIRWRSMILNDCRMNHIHYMFNVNWPTHKIKIILGLPKCPYCRMQNKRKTFYISRLFTYIHKHPKYAYEIGGFGKK